MSVSLLQACKMPSAGNSRCSRFETSFALALTVATYYTQCNRNFALSSELAIDGIAGLCDT